MLKLLNGSGFFYVYIQEYFHFLPNGAFSFSSQCFVTQNDHLIVQRSVWQQCPLNTTQSYLILHISNQSVMSEDTGAFRVPKNRCKCCLISKITNLQPVSVPICGRFESETLTHAWMKKHSIWPKEKIIKTKHISISVRLSVLMRNFYLLDNAGSHLGELVLQEALLSYSW